MSRNPSAHLLTYQVLPSHPTRDVWVEIVSLRLERVIAVSHPTRDVWVEMKLREHNQNLWVVTSHTGCVSRNEIAINSHELLKESHPTRDVWVEIYTPLSPVLNKTPTSHPTRDVWVEITIHSGKKTGTVVTSHTGCVSRNDYSIAESGTIKGHIPHGMCE